MKTTAFNNWKWLNNPPTPSMFFNLESWESWENATFADKVYKAVYFGLYATIFHFPDESENEYSCLNPLLYNKYRAEIEYNLLHPSRDNTYIWGKTKAKTEHFDSLEEAHEFIKTEIAKLWPEHYRATCLWEKPNKYNKIEECEEYSQERKRLKEYQELESERYINYANYLKSEFKRLFNDDLDKYVSHFKFMLLGFLKGKKIIAEKREELIKEMGEESFLLILDIANYYD